MFFIIIGGITLVSTLVWSIRFSLEYVGVSGWLITIDILLSAFSAILVPALLYLVVDIGLKPSSTSNEILPIDRVSVTRTGVEYQVQDGRKFFDDKSHVYRMTKPLYLDVNTYQYSKRIKFWFSPATYEILDVGPVTQ